MNILLFRRTSKAKRGDLKIVITNIFPPILPSPKLPIFACSKIRQYPEERTSKGEVCARSMAGQKKVKNILASRNKLKLVHDDDHSTSLHSQYAVWHFKRECEGDRRRVQRDRQRQRHAFETSPRNQFFLPIGDREEQEPLLQDGPNGQALKKAGQDFL